MKRETRDKFASGTDQSDLTSGNACWETAPLIFQQLAEDFGPFDLDLTADGKRALCPVWFGPDSPVDEPDALSVRGGWGKHGKSGYSNPPYGKFIQRILPIALIQAGWPSEFSSTFLLPLRVTRAFRAYVLNGASDLIFPDKRLVFFEDGAPRINVRTWLEKGKLVPDTALFDSIIVRYRPGQWSAPVISEWRVPVHVTPADLERAAERLKAAA